MDRRPLIPFLIATAATLPGLAVNLTNIHLEAPVLALISGTAIMGASFLLIWACDVAQSDISRTLALAVVALIAVLPEYSVDMYFTWQAGKHPEGDYAQYAIANMTGANRLLIGVAWPLIVLMTWARFRHNVRLAREQNLELVFLAIATAYAFLIPIKGSLAWYDAVVLVAIYAVYLVAAARRPAEQPHLEGPARLIGSLPKGKRRLATAVLFLFAAGVIVADAEAFSEGLVHTGKVLHINEFLLVQWLAPIASESPEFILCLVFVWRGDSAVALGSMLSSKLNQWTLLVGMIPAVFGVSYGSMNPPIPMGSYQMGEIFLTAAQTLLGVFVLLSGRLGVGSGLLLLGLFFSQFALPYLAGFLPTSTTNIDTEQWHLILGLLYIAAALALLAQAPQRVLRVIADAKATAWSGAANALVVDTPEDVQNAGVGLKEDR